MGYFDLKQPNHLNLPGLVVPRPHLLHWDSLTSGCHWWLSLSPRTTGRSEGGPTRGM